MEELTRNDIFSLGELYIFRDPEMYDYLMKEYIDRCLKEGAIKDAIKITEELGYDREYQKLKNIYYSGVPMTAHLLTKRFQNNLTELGTETQSMKINTNSIKKKLSTVYLKN